MPSMNTPSPPDNKLLHAVYTGQLQVVRKLLEEGADIETCGNDGFTPLHMAATQEQLAVMFFLIGKGADTEARDKWGLTPLHHAAGEDAGRLGAEVDARDNEGNTPLHSAVFGDGLGVEDIVDVIKLLQAGGADMAATGCGGRVPADHAVGPNKKAILDLLHWR
ncbi:hypothetical protein Q9L58_010134 [Maublancomyces gigas]|uniref:Uncharacterized protein n=1 Tax=Discina gigas TaxID=1032678 RepID=A0ABR3G604_9PEZI